MAVYLPTGAVGNGRVLATIGAAGEIMTFFYPHTDFAQNVHECLPSLYIGDPGHGVFHWTFGPEFTSKQAYVPETNILRTELYLATPPLLLSFEDFCPPDENALVRIVTCNNLGDGPLVGAFMHYFDLNLGEVPGKQAVRYDSAGGYVLQYFRNVVLTVGDTRPDMWRCGKAWGDHPQSAKQDLYDGHLDGQSEDIGEVDFALGWRLRLAPGQSRRIELIICAAESRDRSVEVFPRLVARGAEALREQTEQTDRAFVRRRRAVAVPDRLQRAYERSLLALSLLGDKQTGSFVAAPEFDPSYEKCGGYGYCWPRDATEAALALRAAGYPEYLQRLADWYARVQLSSGLWAQRYWADGQVAASWSLREDFHQLDQSAAALLAVSIHLQDAPERTPELWPAIERGAGALATRVGTDGWHEPACDLWETYCGIFAYTNAAIATGLREAARVAYLGGHPEHSDRWRRTAEAIRQVVLGSFNGSFFPRGRTTSGRVDPIVDSSTLGLVTPYGLLSSDDPQQRAMIEANIEAIEQRLGQTLHGGQGICRYEGDGYLGGVIGCVNSLWMALVLLKLSRSYASGGKQRAGELRERALGYIDFCLDHATPTGLLPELIGTQPETPYWAAPHSWASGLLVQCVLEMGQPPLRD